MRKRCLFSVFGQILVFPYIHYIILYFINRHDRVILGLITWDLSGQRKELPPRQTLTTRHPFIFLHFVTLPPSLYHNGASTHEDKFSFSGWNPSRISCYTKCVGSPTLPIVQERGWWDGQRGVIKKVLGLTKSICGLMKLLNVNFLSGTKGNWA